MLRQIFGPNRDGNAEKERLHNEELNSLHRSPNIGRVEDGAFKILTRKPTGKRPLGRSKRIWEDNISVYLK